MGVNLQTGGGVEAEQLSASGDALVNDVEEPWVAVAILDVPTGVAVVRVVVRGGALLGLLRSFPAGPGLALDAVDLLDLNLAGEVEVADRR